MHSAGQRGMHFETSLDFTIKNPSKTMLFRWHTECSPSDERVASRREHPHEDQQQQWPPA